MWIRLTMMNDKPIMVNIRKYGNFLQDPKNPTTTRLYQTDAQDDTGVEVKESFQEIERMVTEATQN